MKKYVYIIIGIILIIIVGCLFSCNNNYIPPIEKIVYVSVKDTISEKINTARIAELEHKCYLLQDSLNTVRDSLNTVRDSLNTVKDSFGEDLFITNYKLGRIKYYNDIAAKGNNIKYLRGWINRVLNE